MIKLKKGFSAYENMLLCAPEGENKDLSDILLFFNRGNDKYYTIIV